MFISPVWRLSNISATIYKVSHTWLFYIRLEWLGDVSHIMAELSQSSHERLKDKHKKASKRLSSAKEATLRFEDKKHRMSIARKYLLNIHGDSKRQCFEKRVYYRKRYKSNISRDPRSLKVGNGYLWERFPKSKKSCLVFEDIFQVLIFKKLSHAVCLIAS